MRKTSMMRQLFHVLAVCGLVCSLVGEAVADRPAREEFRETIPGREPPPLVRTEPLPVDSAEWKFRLSPGVTVWFFDKEDDTAGPALFMDFWRTDIPVNWRVGIEGRHLDLEQPSSDAIAEFPGKTPEITFIRIPFSVEYIMPLWDNTDLYLGGGPDIIHTANDLSETEVGGHLAARLHYAFNERWGAAVEGGYLWAQVDGPAGDIELDGAYVTPQVSYTF